MKQNTLAVALCRDGHTECDPDRHTKVVYIRGKNRRVWKLTRSSIDEVAARDDETQTVT